MIKTIRYTAKNESLNNSHPISIIPSLTLRVQSVSQPLFSLVHSLHLRPRPEGHTAAACWNSGHPMRSAVKEEIRMVKSSD